MEGRKKRAAAKGEVQVFLDGSRNGKKTLGALDKDPSRKVSMGKEPDQREMSMEDWWVPLCSASGCEMRILCQTRLASKPEEKVFPFVKGGRRNASLACKCPRKILFFLPFPFTVVRSLQRRRI